MKFAAQIQKELQARTGFSLNFLAESTISAAARHRMASLRCPDADAYWADLQRGGAEWGRLIDEMVITETWFFRDGKPFEFLAARARKEWAGRDRPVRVLSAPCSTGEEPYSIAMTLLDAGVPIDRLHIDALDVSEKALQAARGQIYRAYSFRGVTERPPHYFEPAEKGQFRLSPILHRVVHFRQANLLESGLLLGAEPYDIVFCRNLLIYLEDAARAQLLSTLDRLTSESGVLFVGHADAGAIPPGRFRGCGPAGAFAFARARAQLPLAAFSEAELPQKQVKPAAAPARRAAPAKAPPRLVPASRAAAPPPKLAEKMDAAGKTDVSALAEATRLADAGMLREAAEHCARYLAGSAACAEGIHLMAVIRLAEGSHGEAEQLFQKVAYLNPGHAEALLHLAQLSEARGDEAAARRWRQRMRRVHTQAGA